MRLGAADGWRWGGPGICCAVGFVQGIRGKCVGVVGDDGLLLGL